MLSDKIVQAINQQINAEFYSSYLYYSMSAYCNQKGFKGFSNWMNVQAKEELAHGNHLFEYLLERRIVPQFMVIGIPPNHYEGLKEIFAHVLKHEQFVTERINNIATLAMDERDHGTYQMIQWYITEQIEEESSVEELLQKLILIGNDSPLLYNLDTELAARVYVDPFAAV